MVVALDFLGGDIHVGDLVAYNPPYYKGLKKGIVRKITPKMVMVSRKKSDEVGSQVYHKDVIVFGTDSEGFVW
ncbi:MAG: hypothetical protein JKY52_09540 [Flavobacteriales bacterium]|nr:hypothetical protein [Flavobacteriales bacterium]